MSARRRHARTVLICAILAPAAATHAAGKYYIGPDGGAWSVNANWSNSPAGPSSTFPVGGDDVVIASISSKNIFFNGPSPASNFLGLNLNGTSTALITLTQATNFGFYATNETVGDTGRGAYVQSNGTNVVSNSLIVGNQATSTASYSISGASSVLSVNTNAFLGYNGTATFDQNGGVVAAANFFVAYNPNSSGTYNLNAGAFNAANIVVGDDSNANGTLNQFGGAVTVSPGGSLTLANVNPTSHGTYNLNAGTLNAPAEIISALGVGSFTQSTGTTNTVTGALTINNPNTAGTYTFNGGTLNANTINLNPGGSLKLNADANPFHYSTFNQTGGSIAGPGGAFNVNAGTYNLSGGTLTTDTLQVALGTSASVVHTGGTATLSSLDMGGSGSGVTTSYTLSGSALLSVSTTAYIEAPAGSSTLFQQNGGTFNANSLQFAGHFQTSANYHLTAGSLNTTTESLGNSSNSTNATTFDQTGGTHTVTASLYINPASTYFIHSPAATLTAPLITNDGTFEYYSGNLNAYVVNNGTFQHLPGGTFTGTLENHGTLTLNGPLLPSASFISDVPVTLTTGNAIGAGGTGLTNNNFIQLAGGSLAGAGPITNYASIYGFGSIAGSGGFANYGTLTPSAGFLAITNTGANTNYASVTATPLQQLLISSNLTNAGTLDLNSSIVSGAGSLTNSPAGLLTGPGTLLTTTFVNAGTLLAPAGTTRVNSPFPNTGTLQLADTAANLTGGSISSTGTIQGFGKIANPINNAGTIEPLSATLTLAGPLTNTGLLTTSASTKLLITGSFPTNAGTIALAGGTLDTNNQPLANNNIIAGFGTLRTGGLTNNSSITLTGGPTTVTGPVTNTAGHTLEARFNPVLFTGLVTNAGTLKITAANVTFAGTYVGTPPSEPTGFAQSPGLSTNDDGGLSGPGSLVVDPASTLVTSYVRQSSLLATSGTILTRPSAAGGQASYLSSLTLLGTAQLDLADNNLILDAPDAASVTTATTSLRTYLLNHNVTSSIADADPQHRLAIGYLNSSQRNVSTWGTLAVDTTALLTKLTYLGDANLDGKVDADDYALLDHGFNKHLDTWAFGDFNYDGQVTAADYLLIDRVFIQQTGTLSPSLLAERESQFGATYVTQLLAAVPEPTSAIACLFATYPLLTRRRRRD